MRTTRSNNFSPWITCVAACPPTAACTTASTSATLMPYRAILSRSTSISRLGWPSSRTTVSSVNPGTCDKPPLDFQRLVLKNIQIGPIDFHRQRALQAGQCFVHGIFSRLRVVENHAGKRCKLLLNIFGQLRFVVDRAAFPGGIAIGFQSHVKLIVEETGGIGAVIRTARAPSLRRSPSDTASECCGLAGETCSASSNEIVYGMVARIQRRLHPDAA